MAGGPLGPMAVGLLGSAAVVAAAKGLVELNEEPGFARFGVRRPPIRGSHVVRRLSHSDASAGGYPYRPDLPGDRLRENGRSRKGGILSGPAIRQRPEPGAATSRPRPETRLCGLPTAA